MNSKIRLATSKDIDAVLVITKACAKHMIHNNIFQWNENYPNRKAFENDVHRNELYVLLVASQIVSCVVISSFMDEEYTMYSHRHTISVPGTLFSLSDGVTYIAPGPESERSWKITQLPSAHSLQRRNSDLIKLSIKSLPISNVLMGDR